VRDHFLKLTLHISKDLANRIQAVTGQTGNLSATAFVIRALENAVEELEKEDFPPRGLVDFAGLSRQIQVLEKNQHAILALLNAATTVLASLLRGHGAEN
jgi:hypothetical protein